MIDFKYRDVILCIPKRYYNDNLVNRFKNNTYEKEETTLISKYYDIGDNVLELGSCLGYTTTLLSKKVNSVISVEANPELKDSLIATKIKNDLQNVNYIFGFLSNTRDTVNFQTYDLIVAGSADRLDNGRDWSHTQKNYKVSCVKTNDIPKIESINSLVIDCEGGELEFLIDNPDLLNSVDKITIELHQFMMDDINFDKKCFDILKSHNFVVLENIGTTYHLEKIK